MDNRSYASRRDRLAWGKRNWRRFIAVYTLLFLVLGAAGCWLLYSYCEAYEMSIPEHLMDELLSSTPAERWFETAREGMTASVSAYEDKNALFDEYCDAVLRGKEITWRKNAAEYTPETPVYQVRCAGVDLCTVRLIPRGQQAAGFGRELWQVGEVRSAFTLDRLDSVALELYVAGGRSAYINGMSVGAEHLKERNVTPPDASALEQRFTQPLNYDLYRVEQLFGDITVTDETGRRLSPVRAEEGVIRYTLPPEETYSLTLRAPETVSLTLGGARLTPEDAVRAEQGILSGLESYTGGAAEKTLTYAFTGLSILPEIAAADPDGTPLTPLVNEKGELLFFHAGDKALAGEMTGVVKTFFDSYIDYSSQAFSDKRQQALLKLILPGTELYSYVRDSRDAMIWASATEVRYDELTFADFHAVGADCFTCTVRYKADFSATAWYEKYTYDMQNAYELSFVRKDGKWLAAAMSAVAG